MGSDLIALTSGGILTNALGTIGVLQFGALVSGDDWGPALIAADTAATKNTTNGVEQLNTATTQGKIIAIPSNGQMSYNFRLDAAGTRYLLIECGGFKKLATLTWT